jgi:HEAT repeat protein
LNIRKKIATAVILILSAAASMPASAWDSDSILRELQRDDWEVRLMNKSALESMDNRQSVQALIELIRNQGLGWRLQIRGIRLLGEIHTPQAEDVLLQLFPDLFFHQGCPAVKSSLALALGNSAGPKVVDALIEGLDDPELPVREASIVSLGRVGDTIAVPYLVAQLKDKLFMIRVSAIHSLGLLRDARAVFSLKKIAADDSEPLLRKEAISALSMIRK